MQFPFAPWFDESQAERPCLRDDYSSWLSYGDIRQQIEDLSRSMPGDKSLVFLFARNDVRSVVGLLGALRAGHAVALLDPALTEASRAALAATYQPDFVLDTSRHPDMVASGATRQTIHPDLAILLSTSGSTGSPKFVRLSWNAMVANAAAIAKALSIAGDDIAAAHLPLHYSFGLSTLTGHLISQARVRLTEFGMVDKHFWAAMSDDAVTHLPGVPFHFKIMERMRYERLPVPALKSLAQAGGFLDGPSRQAAHAFMDARGGRFYVMYGQTEAAPRMTTLPHEDFPTAPASVGYVLDGGRLDIADPDPTGIGEVVYSGPNVMMGYAESRADLRRGDEQGGHLVTGDIGSLDSAGRLTLIGRTKRFAKIHGLRVNLDEVEDLANTVCETAVTSADDRIDLHIVCSDANGAAMKAELLAALKGRFVIPATAYRIRIVGEIRRTERGKVDYRMMQVDR